MKKLLAGLFGLLLLIGAAQAVPLGQGLGDYFPLGITVTTRPATLDGITLTTVSTTQGNVASGIYTPTVTGVNQTTVVVAEPCMWTRIGNNVRVDGAFTGDMSTVGTGCQVSISLPIASDLTATTDAGGVVSGSGTNAHGQGVIYGRTATNDVLADICQIDAHTSHEYGISFSYVIK